jgi:23S rRNA pseudouridine1911/1915/1917 synthase
VRSYRFTLTLGEPPQRLDTLVVSLLACEGVTSSRSAVQQWIDHGNVSVNGTPVRKGSARVAAGAAIEVQPEEPPPTDAVADPSVQVKVIYEDDALIVIDKPAGLVVHPARGHATGTLVNGLLARGSFDAAPVDDRDPEGKRRPGIVHRLDKDTSGVLVVARTPEAREGLKALFAKHDIEREYHAVVIGRANDGTYDTMIGRHPTDRLRFTTRTSVGRRAVTHVKVAEHVEGAALVVCHLETGRTHQIRVHLSECGCTPVLGDALYGGKPRDARVAAIAKTLGRQWLHARVLGFVHPITGQRMRFESAIPAELQEAWRALCRSSTEPRA